MKFISSLLSVGLIVGANAAEWKVVNPRILSVALGISAPDNKNVYATGGNDGTLADIVKSEDGGSTWSSLPHDPQLVYLDIDIAKGSTTGAAVAAGLFGAYSGLSYTTDGKTFQSTSDRFTALGGQNVRAIDSSTFYTVGYWQKSLFDPSEDGVIASFNAGKSFEYYPWNQELQVRYGAFPTNTTWYLTGGRFPASQEKSENEKKITSRLSIVKNEDGSITTKFNDRLQTKSKNDEYAGSIARTTDGGRTFQELFFDSGLFYFNAIDCVDEVTCWAVAEGPLGAWIYHTKNGVDWSEQYQKYDLTLLDIQMLNSKEGWAVGGNIARGLVSTFLHTTDGGATWVDTSNLSNVYPVSVSIVSSEKAYAAALLITGGAALLAYE